MPYKFAEAREQRVKIKNDFLNCFKARVRKLGA